MRARVYVGAAGIDPTFPDEQRQRLQTALDAAGVSYVIDTRRTQGTGLGNGVWCTTKRHRTALGTVVELLETGHAAVAMRYQWRTQVGSDETVRGESGVVGVLLTASSAMAQRGPACMTVACDLQADWAGKHKRANRDRECDARG